MQKLLHRKRKFYVNFWPYSGEGTKTQVQIVKTQVQIAETQVSVSLLRWGETKKRTKKSLAYSQHIPTYFMNKTNNCVQRLEFHVIGDSVD